MHELARQLAVQKESPPMYHLLHRNLSEHSSSSAGESHMKKLTLFFLAFALLAPAAQAETIGKLHFVIETPKGDEWPILNPWRELKLDLYVDRQSSDLSFFPIHGIANSDFNQPGAIFTGYCSESPDFMFCSLQTNSEFMEATEYTLSVLISDGTATLNDYLLNPHPRRAYGPTNTALLVDISRSTWFFGLGYAPGLDKFGVSLDTLGLIENCRYCDD